MSWDKVKKAVGKIAPVVGAAINPVFGGVVGSVIADALGVEDDPGAVQRAIKADPQAAAKILEIQAKHKEKLEELAFKREELVITAETDKLKSELSDKADARANHKHSPIPAFVTLGLTILFAASLQQLFTSSFPAQNEKLIFVLVGQLSALWGASITYWVGTTRSSAEKTRLIR